MTLKEAILLATEKHGECRDRCGVLYILHPIAVMMDLQKRGCDEVVLKVAVLHDVIEDTDVELVDICDQLTQREYDALKAITKLDEEDYWTYIKRVKENEIATIVKKADLKHNNNIERLVKTGKDFMSITKRYVKAYAILDGREV